MIPTPATLHVPLETDFNGVIRVSDTRVTLDTLINYYLQEESAEELHRSFPTVPLTDIYSVIAYYLANRDEVDAYLRQQRERAEQTVQQIEASYTSKQRAFNDRVRALAEATHEEQDS